MFQGKANAGHIQKAQRLCQLFFKPGIGRKAQRSQLVGQRLGLFVQGSLPVVQFFQLFPGVLDAGQLLFCLFQKGKQPGLVAPVFLPQAVQHIQPLLQLGLFARVKLHLAEHIGNFTGSVPAVIIELADALPQSGGPGAKGRQRGHRGLCLTQKPGSARKLIFPVQGHIGGAEPL